MKALIFCLVLLTTGSVFAAADGNPEGFWTYQVPWKLNQALVYAKVRIEPTKATMYSTCVFPNGGIGQATSSAEIRIDRIRKVIATKQASFAHTGKNATLCVAGFEYGEIKYRWEGEQFFVQMKDQIWYALQPVVE